MLVLALVLVLMLVLGCGYGAAGGGGGGANGAGGFAGVAIAKLVPYDCCADGVDGSVDDGDDDGISGLLLFFMEHGYRYCSSS